MKKVAVPVENDVLVNVFEHCFQFKIFTIENQKISDEKLITAPHHQFGLFPFWLATNSVTDVIAYKMSHETINKFNCLKINVFVGVEKRDSILLINEFIKGVLETNAEVCDNEMQSAHQQ
jgi:predicted Fe-Mo cluster-binding NifX family protein